MGLTNAGSWTKIVSTSVLRLTRIRRQHNSKKHITKNNESMHSSTKLQRMRNMLIMLALITVSSVIVPFSIHAQPRLVMDNEVSWGTVIPPTPSKEDQKIHRTLTLTNAGDSTLEISEVRVQCGCTSAPLDKNVLAPGEKTSMHITLNLPAGSGKLSKYVTVFSNDPSGAHVLRLSVDVLRPIQLESGFLAFNRGDVGTPSAAEVELAVNADSVVTLSVDSPTPGVRITTPMPMKVSKGERAKIGFEFTPTAPGPFNVIATLRTSLKGYETIELSGYGVATSPRK
jgi:hypothetical protein